MHAVLTQIGQKKESDFDEPIGMLEDCHKRILYFLKTLVAVVDTGKGCPLSEDQRTSLEKALRYFREAAPKHTADEEESLFPRLRLIDAPEVCEISSKLDVLEADHERANAEHFEVEAIGQRWLQLGSLTSVDTDRLKSVLDSLTTLYARHISLEETDIFAIAKAVLSEPEKQALGKQMAERRGIVLHRLNAITM